MPITVEQLLAAGTAYLVPVPEGEALADGADA